LEQLDKLLERAMAVKNTWLGRTWYTAYCAAMLETDAEKIFAGVEAARKAIHERVLELGLSLSGANHESKELERALRFLAMLVDCSCMESNHIAAPAVPVRENFIPTARAFASAAQ